MRLSLLIAVLLLSVGVSAYSQEKGTEKSGSVKGILRDSVYNRSLSAATVSIYALPSDKLLTYQVSNSLGEFEVKNLPISTDLKLVISNVGYHQVTKKLNINSSSKSIDFKTIFMHLATVELDEVNVTIPPMQMNGDTLEFNSAAFKLDSNAVVHDLMKKISNITLWGDGKITVNGREIKVLLVNGKEFMGGDAKIAIENIPKNAVDKIQVYNTVDNPRNLADTSLNMNLKLKKGKDIGYFGKVGGGYGSAQRFEGDMNLNIFSPKLQIALVGAANNINKIATNINTLQRNSTFKGVGAQVDYMTDFRTVGINQPRSAGYSFKYDFSEKTAKDNISILTSDYFLLNNKIQREGAILTKTAIAGGTNIAEQNNNSGNENNTSQSFTSGYQFSKDRYEINFSQNIDINSNKSNNESQSTSSDENQRVVSTSSNSNKNESLNKSYGMKLDFNFGPKTIIGESRFAGFRIAYSFDLSDVNSNRENLTNFESIINPAKNQFYNRKYNNFSKTWGQKVNFELPSMMNLIFGIGSKKPFEVDFKSDLKINNTSSSNDVYDYNKTLNQLIRNSYLTNNTTFRSLIYEPALEVHKTITQSLTNRFDRSWYFYLNVRSQLYYQNNKSEKSFQNIKRRYDNFLPNAGISFSDSQYGEYRSEVSIAYDKSVVIPTIGQLAPLTDSTNVYFLRTVNLNLQEEKSHALTLSFKRSSEKKNSFNYKFTAGYSKVVANIIDSTTIDAQNVRTIYKINNSDNSNFSLTGNVNKAIKFKNSEAQLSLNSNYNHNQNPNIVNGIQQNLVTDYLSNSAKINYTYKTILAIEASQSITNTISRQSKNANDVFKNSILSTAFSASFNVTKKMKINSNISISTNISEGLENINYNIWNASATYRLLKGNNLEIKFSALDLLHQNTSVINTNRSGVITLGSQNVLQQYFIYGISYYPRKFGKDAKK